MRYPKHLSGAHSKDIIDRESQRIARAALDGVGDASLGEWLQAGNPGPTGARVWHLRRRLSMREAIEYGLRVIDMRNTDAGIERLRKLFSTYPMLKHVAIAVGEWPNDR